MSYKKWVKHLIERFGEVDIYRWAHDWSQCPCYYLVKKCVRCEHQELFKFPSDGWCTKASEFYFEFYNNRESLFKLKEKIKKESKQLNRIFS